MKRVLSAIAIPVLLAGIVLAGCSLLRVPPSVDFAASSVEGRAPFAVRFTSQVEGTATSYRWSFGDGWTSEEPSPVHVYTQEGTYGVMLTVGFADHGPVTRVKKRPVTVDKPLRKASGVYLYWISGYAVYRGGLDGSGAEILANNWQPPSGLDVGGGRIYWVTTLQTGGVLESANLDGTDRQKLVSEENRLGDVAVDAEHGKVYWTSLPESPRSVFENGTWDGGRRRANLDGSSVKTLIE